MILEVDIGNTRLKWRLRAGVDALAQGCGSSAAFSEWLFDAWRQLPASPDQVWVASVRAPAATRPLHDWCLAHWGVPVQFARSQVQAAGVHNGYRQPERLGVDRWLALLAARALCPGPVLVVDAGSALTVDLLTAKGEHLGGYIGPGLALMARTLGQDTDGVRVDWQAQCQPVPGRDTESAVSGALLAMALGLVERARGELALRSATEQPPMLLLTGGDAEQLAPWLPGAQVCEALVLDGLALALPT